MARSRTDPLPSPDGGLGEQDTSTIRAVVDAVVDAFVETEVKRRADILTAGVNTMRQLEADVKKIKPDVVHVNEDGSPAASLYTPAKQKELTNHRQKMANLDAAISAVLEKHDADSFNKLDQAIKKASSKGNGSFSY